MTIHDKISKSILQYHSYRSTSKISALSSGKKDKYEYLTVEEILHQQ